MDDFVEKTLDDWQLSDLKENFQVNKVTEESLFGLTENDITQLIPEIGPRARFRYKLKTLKDVRKADVVREVLEKNMKQQLDQVTEAVEKEIKDFEQCLTNGVGNSQTSGQNLKTFLDSDENPIAFKTLKALVWKNGIHETKKREKINLNRILASCLIASIDEKFEETFPNDGRYFNGVISRFSLGIHPLIQENQHVKMQLIFLQAEEKRIKEKLKRIMLEQKELIYNSLTETIMESMQQGYIDAQGENTRKNMRDTLVTHSSNSNMYKVAKTTMLEKMNELKMTICKELKETMGFFIELLFKADVSKEVERESEMQAQ